MQAPEPTEPADPVAPAEFYVSVVTTGFGGIYLNNKRCKLIEVCCVAENGEKYHTYCYPDDAKDFKIHPESAKLHGFKSVEEIVRTGNAVAASVAVRDLYAFVDRVAGTRPPVLIGHHVRFIHTALALVLEPPRAFEWVDSRSVFKAFYPEMEQFRWELIAINDNLKRIQEQRYYADVSSANAAAGRTVRVSHVDTDPTPYRFKNILRYFYRDNASYAYSTKTSALASAQELKRVYTEHARPKLGALYHAHAIDTLFTRPNRMTQRICDLPGLKKDTAQRLADFINAAQLSINDPNLYFVNQNVLTVGDLLLFVCVHRFHRKEKATKEGREPLPVYERDRSGVVHNSWRWVAQEIEMVFREGLGVYSDDAVLSVLAVVLGMGIPSLIKDVYPASAGLREAFHPFQLTDKMAFALWDKLDIKTSTDLRAELLACKDSENEYTRAMNRIRVVLYGVHPHNEVNKLFNISTVDEAIAIMEQ